MTTPEEPTEIVYAFACGGYGCNGHLAWGMDGLAGARLESVVAYVLEETRDECEHSLAVYVMGEIRPRELSLVELLELEAASGRSVGGAFAFDVLRARSARWL